MSRTSLTKLLSSSLLALGLTACAGPHDQAHVAALDASAEARGYGIHGYRVDGDRAAFYDEVGVRVGELVVDSSPDNRVLFGELPDGSVDMLEVYRPLDGRFVAPIAPVSALTTVAADLALAPFFAAHAIRFNRLDGVLGGALVDPEAVATTSKCVDDTSSSPIKKAWVSDTPLGCARPANPDVSCANNDSVYPPTLTSSPTWVDSSLDGVTSTYCQANKFSACLGSFGGTSADWTNSTARCVKTDALNLYKAQCLVGSSANVYNAICPRVTCSIAGQYDLVPRIRACNSPGSCTKSQGTVTCTTTSGTVSTVCGDGACNGSETSASCPGDCGATSVCGDGTCNGTETTTNCPDDCPSGGCYASGTMCGMTVSGCLSPTAYGNCGSCCSGYHSTTPFACNGSGGTASSLYCN